MSSLFRNPASATGGSNGLSASDMQARKEQIKAEVQTALQTANAQELINVSFAASRDLSQLNLM